MPRHGGVQAALREGDLEVCTGGSFYCVADDPALRMPDDGVAPIQNCLGVQVVQMLGEGGQAVPTTPVGDPDGLIETAGQA